VRELTACPLCGDVSARELYRFEPALWIPGRVIRCVGCHIVYKQPSEAAKPVAQYYQERRYQELDYWSREDEARATLNKIRNSILGTLGSGAGRTLLDVGCGPGLFLGLAQQAGFEVAGVELNPQLALRAGEHTNGAEIIISDFMKVPADRRFDVISMLDLIEHLPDPLAALRHARQMLKPDGHIVLYTPNHRGIICRVADAAYRASGGRFQRPVVEIFDCLHVVFFDISTLKLALRKTGFQVIKTATWAYDPVRSALATGLWSLGVRSLEAIGGGILGKFRILMFGKKLALEPQNARNGV
jgi:SAM-dependent methyltransferase